MTFEDKLLEERRSLPTDASAEILGDGRAQLPVRALDRFFRSRAGLWRSRDADARVLWARPAIGRVPSTKGLELGELAQNSEIDPRRLALEHLVPSSGDARDTPARTREQTRLREVGGRPPHSIVEPALAPAWQSLLAFRLGELEMIGDLRADRRYGVLQPVRMQREQGPHDRLEVRDGHANPILDAPR